MKRKKPVAKSKTPKHREFGLRELREFSNAHHSRLLKLEGQVAELEKLKKLLFSVQDKTRADFVSLEHWGKLGGATVAGVQPATPEPTPAAPIPPRCPHGLARGFWAMGETKPCKRTDQHIHHATAGGVIWNEGARWDRILKDGVWTRP